MSHLTGTSLCPRIQLKSHPHKPVQSISLQAVACSRASIRLSDCILISTHVPCSSPKIFTLLSIVQHLYIYISCIRMHSQMSNLPLFFVDLQGFRDVFQRQIYDLCTGCIFGFEIRFHEVGQLSVWPSKAFSEGYRVHECVLYLIREVTSGCESIVSSDGYRHSLVSIYWTGWCHFRLDLEFCSLTWLGWFGW